MVQFAKGYKKCEIKDRIGVRNKIINFVAGQGIKLYFFVGVK